MKPKPRILNRMRRMSDHKEVVVDQDREPWHLSKSVPLGLVFAILIQTFAMVGGYVAFRTEFTEYRKSHDMVIAARTLAVDKRFEELAGKTDQRYRSSDAAADFALRDQRIESLKETVLTIALGVNNLDKTLDEKFERLTQLIQRNRDLYLQTNAQRYFQPPFPTPVTGEELSRGNKK